MNIDQLLSYFWSYPNPENSRASWAVKESLILKNRVKEAEDNPGLGIAVLSTELALQVFGKQSSSDKIAGSLQWAESRYPVSSPVDIAASEFSQRLAYGIVQLRTENVRPSFDTFIDAAFDISTEMYFNPDDYDQAEGICMMNQCHKIFKEKKWFLDDCHDASVFTVLYAAELLDLYIPTVANIPKRNLFIERRANALSWLASHNQRLWSAGGIFAGSEILDKLVTSAWIIIRLSRFSALPLPEWQDLLRNTMSQMVLYAENEKTWAGVDPLLRYRVEARVAAATSMYIQRVEEAHGSDIANKYLACWQLSREKNDLDESQYDLATAIAVMQALMPYGTMASLPIVSSLKK